MSRILTVLVVALFETGILTLLCPLLLPGHQPPLLVLAIVAVGAGEYVWRSVQRELRIEDGSERSM